MRITVVGRGNVGGGLADLWERAGHQVTRLGRDGGDVSDADVVLVAVPGHAIADAFDRIQGAEGKTVIDATNLYGVTPPDGFASNAESRTGGPTAKSFSLNAAQLYERAGETRERPSNLWSGDEEAHGAARAAVTSMRLDGLHHVTAITEMRHIAYGDAAAELASCSQPFSSEHRRALSRKRVTAAD